MNDGKSSIVEVRFDVPPSANRLLVNRRGTRQRVLSNEARKYQMHVQEVMRPRMLEFARWLRNPAGTGPEIYMLEIEYRLRGFENPAFFEQIERGKYKGERKAKLRYKKVDIDNRIKYLQDCFTRTLGLEDDSSIFDVRAFKSQVQTEDEEGVVVRLCEGDRKDYGLP